MKRPSFETKKTASQKASLRRRIKSLYQRYNQGAWQECFLHIDPKLRNEGKVELGLYGKSLGAFKQRYGNVSIWHVKINLHLDPHNNKRDERAFAYVYVFWQDDHKAFHVFRERWVEDSGRWYTRVVGLVAHANATAKEG
jgi:hypothetical protein